MQKYFNLSRMPNFDTSFRFISGKNGGNVANGANRLSGAGLFPCGFKKILSISCLYQNIKTSVSRKMHTFAAVLSMTLMRKYLFLLAMAIVALGFTACTDDNPTQQGRQPSGIDMSNLDTSVRPGDDFYQYACGGWIKNNPLPAAYSRYGSMEKLAEENQTRIKAVLDNLQTGNFVAGSTEQKLADLYRMAMDSQRRNQQGVEPLMGIIRQMEQATTVEQLFQIHLQLIPENFYAFLTTFFTADEKNSKMNILKVKQGGIGMGLKEYYLDTATADIREAYKQTIIKMFRHFGFNEQQVSQKMANVMHIETELAKVSRSVTELRAPEANYNKMSLAQFNAAYPHIQLEKLMNAMGVQSAHIQELVVGQPEFCAGADQLIATMSADEYRDYMEWIEISRYAEYLDDTMEAIYFDFYGRMLSGRQQDYPLWQRVMTQMDNLMGEAVGKLFVEKYFPAAAKERMLELVSNLQVALAQRIDAQDWMSDATKTAAKEKLAAFIVKVGYPDKWTDMSALHIDNSKSYVENVILCTRFENAENVKRRAGKPVDPTRWGMTPQTVNAYYEPTTNEISFPAAILQPPYFDMEADDAINYGAIGVIIGHEMTHGFDDAGRLYDKDGNLNNWWTPDDAAKFQEKADMYADYFDAIEVLPGLHANGRMTLGENLADHGGLQVAWTAYHNAVKTPPATIDGFTADQRFFLSYANIWAQNITDAELRLRTTSDVHSQGRWRVNGALPHIDAWYEVFGIKEGDKLFVPKEKRLQLW